MLAYLSSTRHCNESQASELCNELETAIIDEAMKRIEKKRKKEKRAQINSQRFQKRTATEPHLSPQLKPNFPDIFFDPEFCLSNAGVLAQITVSRALYGNYTPVPALRWTIPKPDGSNRTVEMFSIVDAAFEKVIFQRVRARNLDRFSACSYAYHPTRNAADAVKALCAAKPRSGNFVVQIDFKNYFENIPHEFIMQKINDTRYELEDVEKHVIIAFIQHLFASRKDYATSNFLKRDRGVPQGATISLFLANLVSDDLDHTLVPIADFYARYADDTLALCTNIESAWEIVAKIEAFCNQSGIIINREKSPGIRIIDADHDQVARAPSIDFLGYRYENEKLKLSERTVKRLKKYISRIVHLHLFHYLNHGFNRKRCARYPFQYDWDLVALISEVRNFLYGGLSEDAIRAFIRGELECDEMPGIMRSYCLIDDASQLAALDGFIVNLIRRAMRARRQLLCRRFNCACPAPSNRQLIDGTWLDKRAWRGSQLPDLRLASFVRAWQAAYIFHVSKKGRARPVPDSIAYDPLEALNDDDGEIDECG